MASKRVSQKEIVVSGAVAPRHQPASTRRTRPVTKPAEPVAAAPQAVKNDEVARLAYSYWEARGYQGGSPDEDWIRAEKELSTCTASATA
jgi:hypothetical protein